MATDIATLGVKVDASEADTAGAKLNELANQGGKAEAGVKKVTKASLELNAQLQSLIAQIRDNTGATAASMQAQQAEAAAARASAAAAAASAAARRKAADEARALAQAERMASEAADDMANRLQRLRQSVDPLGVAQDRVNSELAEARMLFEAGALSADQYARAQTVLNARMNEFQTRGAGVNKVLSGTAGASRLTANEALNLSRQFADIGVTAAMGMNPLMILVQQGPQIADIMKTSGLSMREMAREMLLFLKIIEVVPAANAVAAASHTTVATTAVAAATAEDRFAAATGRASMAAKEATAANAALATSNGAVAVSAEAVDDVVDGSSKKIATRLGRIPRVAGPALLVLGAIATGFAAIANEAEKGLGDVQKEFGLTEGQMEKLKKSGEDTGYTIGDVMSGTAATIGDVFKEEIDFVKKKFAEWFGMASKGASDASNNIIDSFIGALITIKENWRLLPAAIGDAAIQAANAVIRAVNGMVKGSVDTINSLLDKLPDWVGITGRASFSAFNELDNPNAGAAVKLGTTFSNNRKRAGKMRATNTAEARDDRLEKAFGEAEDGPNPRKRKPRATKEKESEAEKAYKRAVEGAQDYLQSLKEETEEIGKNKYELKELNVQREIDALMKVGQTKETLALAAAIRKEHEAWVNATEDQAVKEYMKNISDANKEIAFEASLIGMNNEQRERAIALRKIEMEQAAFLKENPGVVLVTGKDNRATAAAEKGAMQDRVDEAGRMASAMRDTADAVSEVTASFGELFGTAGEGFANLIDTMLEFDVRRAEGMSRLLELQQEYNEGQMTQAEYDFQRGQVNKQMSRDQIAQYGEMIGAAKTFFKEGSTGWRVMEAAERAYRIFQFAMQIRAMLMDKASTTSSVANSGVRAAADGVAAVAKAIASLPFPLNIAAGAATAAFLVAMGVKLFGGKGGGGASASASKAVDRYNGPRDEYGAPTSSYSVLKPGQVRTGAAANDNRTGAPANVGNTVVIQGDTLKIEGGADRRTVEEMQQMLQQRDKNLIQQAREAVAADQAAKASRQRIGGR